MPNSLLNAAVTLRALARVLLRLLFVVVMVAFVVFVVLYGELKAGRHGGVRFCVAWDW